MLFEIWIERRRRGALGQRWMARHGKRIDVKVDSYVYKVPMEYPGDSMGEGGVVPWKPRIPSSHRSTWDLFRDALHNALSTYTNVGDLQNASNAIWHEGNPHSLYAFHTHARPPTSTRKQVSSIGLPFLSRILILPPLALLKRLSAQTICTVPGGLDACDCLVYTPLDVRTSKVNARVTAIETSPAAPLFRLVVLHRPDGALGPLQAVLDHAHLVALDSLLEEGRA